MQRQFPDPAEHFPVHSKKIPCFVIQGIQRKALEFAGEFASRFSLTGGNRGNSLFFSLLPGNFVLETSSTTTASATTHSRATGDFLKLRQWPRFGGILSGSSVSAKGPSDFAPGFALLSLASKSRCPATETSAG
jgi:hypothetical protein